MTWSIDDFVINGDSNSLISMWPVFKAQCFVEHVHDSHTQGLQDLINSSSPSAEYMYASVNWIGVSSGNGMSPVRHQAITWTNANLLSIGPLGTNFCEIRIKMQNFHLRKCIWRCCLRNGGHFVQGEMS